MKKLLRENKLSKSKGFSLLELAIVLVIVGLLISAFLAPLSAQRDLRDYSDAKAHLEQIRDALYGYAIINGRLPCSTTTVDPLNNVNYGHEDATCPLTAAAGVLPWKDLGVTEVDSWNNPRILSTDPWTGYWVYRVDPAFTSTFTLATTPTGNIDVKKADGTSQTIAAERAVAVVCTTGKNKVADGENATYENTPVPVINPLPPTNPVYQDDAQSPTFDDMCIWITRPSLFNHMVSAGKLP